MSNLESLRSQIDTIDHKIIGLLNERVRLAAEIGKIKRAGGQPIYVAEREETVLRRLAGINEGPLDDKAIRAIYREIMSAAIALEKPMVISYLGPAATFTHQAALKKFGASVDYRALATISDVFLSVERGESDYGVIPIENSTEGAVFHSMDRFVDSELKITAQVYLEVVHHLIGHGPLESVRTVYSKDQALGQCRIWLQSHLPWAAPAPCASTSRAVELARAETEAAAIASDLAAEMYGVPILASAIQDKADNTTRFLIIAKQAAGPLGEGRDKSSYLFSLNDEVGVLERALHCFSSRGINLCKIESRPSRKRPWDYLFFVDIIGHHEDPPTREALTELKRVCPLVKWLGSYPNTR